jgi:hypothetical protein
VFVWFLSRLSCVVRMLCIFLVSFAHHCPLLLLLAICCVSPSTCFDFYRLSLALSSPSFAYRSSLLRCPCPLHHHMHVSYQPIVCVRENPHSVTSASSDFSLFSLSESSLPMSGRAGRRHPELSRCPGRRGMERRRRPIRDQPGAPLSTGAFPPSLTGITSAQVFNSTTLAQFTS